MKKMGRINQKAVLGILIAALMILSVFGMVVDYAVSPSKKIKYGDYKFKAKQNYWVTEINDKEYTFTFVPQDLEELEIIDQAKAILKNKDVYTITYDPDNRDAQDIAQVLYQIEQEITKPIVEPALTNNTDTILLQRSCANATVQQPVIYYKEADEAKITVDGNCVLVESVDSRDIVMQSDLIKYLFLGVM